MNQAGMTAPCASLRWPVSISWLMSTLTSVESPTTLARIFIGSAMSSSASAQRHFDVLGSDVVLPILLDQREDVRALSHLHARRHRRVGSRRNVEHRRDHVGIPLDQ